MWQRINSPITETTDPTKGWKPLDRIGHMDLHQHGSFPREWGSMSGRTKLPSLSCFPTCDWSFHMSFSYLSRPKIRLFGRDVKKVAFSLEPWSISRSILSSWSNAFLKILTTQWTPLLHWDGPRPPTERAMYCSLYQAIAFKCPTPIWMIFPWSMSEKARASQRVTIAKWCFQVVQSRSRTKRRRRVVFVLSTLRLPLSINGDPPKGE